MAGDLNFTLAEVAEVTSGQIIVGNPEDRITDVCIDTRAAPLNGALFVALRGQHYDGHDFISKARAAGARAALISNTAKAPHEFPLVLVRDTQRAYGDLARAHRLCFQVPVVAITGSYGKTTTRALTAQALSPKFRVLSSENSFNNEIGVPMTLLKLDGSHDIVSLELAMRGRGHIKYLAEIALPTIGVITNIGPQDVGLLGTLDNIAKAKSELVESLPADGLAVLPSSDQYFNFLRQTSQCSIATFGHQEADYRVSDITADSDGLIHFSLSTRSGINLTDVKLPVGGKFNALNADAPPFADNIHSFVESLAGEVVRLRIIRPLKPARRKLQRCIPDRGLLFSGYVLRRASA